MKKRFGISDEERKIFRESVKNVTPLKQYKRISTLRAQTEKKKREVADSTLKVLDLCPVGNISSLRPLYAEDALYFMRPGLQVRVMQRLRRGEIAVEAELDLHGLTVLQAHSALFQFLSEAVAQGLRCLLVIHGKGGRAQDGVPTLKNYINYWLPQYPVVMGFCSAHVREGGKGACCVLLRNSLKRKAGQDIHDK